MPDLPAFSPQEEERIQRKLEEFQKVVDELKKRDLNAGFGIDPGTDPLAREALTRVLERSLVQAMERYAGRPLDVEAREEMKGEFREQVKAMFERNVEKKQENAFEPAP